MVIDGPREQSHGHHHDSLWGTEVLATVPRNRRKDRFLSHQFVGLGSKAGFLVAALALRWSLPSRFPLGQQNRSWLEQMFQKRCSRPGAEERASHRPDSCSARPSWTHSWSACLFWKWSSPGWAAAPVSWSPELNQLSAWLELPEPRAVAPGLEEPPAGHCNRNHRRSSPHIRLATTDGKDRYAR